MSQVATLAAKEVRTLFTSPIAYAVIAVFGPPVDYADLLAEKPRPTLYKKCADRFMAEVGKLAIRERELRAELAAGQIAEDDLRWIDDRAVSRLYAREGRD